MDESPFKSRIIVFTAFLSMAIQAALIAFPLLSKEFSFPDQAD
jgi:hypothetical protein